MAFDYATAAPLVADLVAAKDYLNTITHNSESFEIVGLGNLQPNMAAAKRVEAAVAALKAYIDTLEE